MEFSEDDLHTSIGEHVRAARSGCGLTQEALGEVVGLGRTSITNIERGRQHITVATLYRIASALGLDPAELLPTQTPASAPTLESMPDLTEQERDWILTIVSPATAKDVAK